MSPTALGEPPRDEYVFKFGFIGALDLNVTFLCTFLSPAKEKYQKKRRIRENLRFFLMYPFPSMVAHAVLMHRVDCAQSDLHQACRVDARR